jgi:hypothetical protein
MTEHTPFSTWRITELEQQKTDLTLQLQERDDFMVFDAGVKKTCRHNQYFGVKAARPQVQRARSRTTVRQAAHAREVTSMSE